MSNIDDEIKKAIEDQFPDGFTLHDEANAIVAKAFRNGPIEDLHADNRGPSKITQEEMKTIMLEACKRMEKILRGKQEDQGAYLLEMMDYNRQYCRAWQR